MFCASPKNFLLRVATVVCLATVCVATVTPDPRNSLIPRITSNPTAKVIEKGSDITLICSLPTRSTAQGVDLVWHFNGKRLSSARFRSTENGTSQLEIQNAKFSDKGLYSCGLRSYTEEYRNSTTLSVGIKPNALLSCESSNHLEVFCHWNETDSNLPTNVTFAWRLNYEDHWSYCGVSKDKIPMLQESCTCQDNRCHFPMNNGGSHVMKIELTNALGVTPVTEWFNPDTDTIPNPPESVSAMVSETNAISLTWSKPTDWLHTFQLLYRVQYTHDLTSLDWKEIDIPYPDQRQFVLESCDVATHSYYYFKVACMSSYAGNDDKWSEWSNVASCRIQSAEEPTSGSRTDGLPRDFSTATDVESNIKQTTSLPLRDNKNTKLVIKTAGISSSLTLLVCLLVFCLVVLVKRRCAGKRDTECLNANTYRSTIPFQDRLIADV